MKSIVNKIEGVIQSGLALKLSHFFITFILLLFTIAIVYRIFMIIETRKFLRSKATGDDLKHSELSWLPDGIERWIIKQEKLTNTSIVPILIRYFVLGILAMTVIPFLSLITGRSSTVFTVASILVGLMIMIMPIFMVNTMARNRRNLINLEIPEYLESFALLKQNKTLFQTTLDSYGFAGPTIRPYVEQLILEVQLNPGSHAPYKDFARKLDNVEVETFMNTMIETTNVDKKLENELIAEELSQVSRMRSDVYSAVIDDVEGRLGLRNLALSFPIIVIVLVFMFYTIAKIIQDSGIF